MSSKLPPVRDQRQLRLGFEASTHDGRRWCTTCQAFIDEELFDLFHDFGHPPRPYDAVGDPSKARS